VQMTVARRLGLGLVVGALLPLAVSAVLGTWAQSYGADGDPVTRSRSCPVITILPEEGQSAGSGVVVSGEDFDSLDTLANLAIGGVPVPGYDQFGPPSFSIVTFVPEELTPGVKMVVYDVANPNLGVNHCETSYEVLVDEVTRSSDPPDAVVVTTEPSAEPEPTSTLAPTSTQAASSSTEPADAPAIPDDGDSSVTSAVARTEDSEGGSGTQVTVVLFLLALMAVGGAAFATGREEEEEKKRQRSS
jgi:hypothetical protein